MISFYSGIPFGFLWERGEGKGFILIPVSLLIYVIYSSCTDTCKYINNLVELPQVFKNIAFAIKSAPDV